jgi:MFS family permease
VQAQAALGLHSAQWGALYGLATGASGLLMFWLGAMADRVATRRAISIALAILACGSALMATAQAPWMLLLGFFCLRLGGQGLCSHLAIVTAARHALHRGRSIATAAFGFILGEAMLPLVVTALMGWIDWRWVWACAGALVLLVAMPVLRRIAAPLPLDVSHPPTAQIPDVMARRQLLRRPACLAALPVMLTLPFVVTSVFLHQGALSAQRGWTPAQVAMGILGFALVQATTTWASGRWIDRHGARWIFRVYLWPLAVGMLLGGFAPSALAVWGLFLGMGMASGAQSVLSGALWAELFGVRQLGMVRGVFTALMVLSTAASPPILGYALQIGTPLTALTGAVAAYAVITPWLVARWIRPVAPTAVNVL